MPVEAWKLRVVVYGFVALLAALVLVPRALSDDDDERRTLVGSTEQRRPVSIYLDGERIEKFQFGAIDSACDNGSRFTIRWFPYTDQGNVSYSRKGRAFLVHEWHHPHYPHPPGMRVDLWMEGRFTKAGGADGVVTFTGRTRHTTCMSGRVRFSARP